MRALLLAVAFLAACAAPRPCTQALCPGKVGGEYRVSGWGKSVTVSAGAPPIPIVSDSEVTVSGGPAEFVNRRTVVRAEPGATFTFLVSSDSVHAASLVVSSGSVSVSVASAAPVALAAGAPFVLESKP